jgi:hypothetical protein
MRDILLFEGRDLIVGEFYRHRCNRIIKMLELGRANDRRP